MKQKFRKIYIVKITDKNTGREYLSKTLKRRYDAEKIIDRYERYKKYNAVIV